MLEGNEILLKISILLVETSELIEDLYYGQNEVLPKTDSDGVVHFGRTKSTSSALFLD